MIKKTGLLLPRSVLYPSINFDLLEGLRAGLEANELNDMTIVTDNIGVGANDQLTYNTCERLLMDGCSVIAGYVNPSTAQKLQPLFASANALFICIDSGYQFMLPDPQVLPNVLFVSLQGVLCCRATAHLAVQAGFESFAFTTSFLDAGYRASYAYARAIEQGGASIAFNHVTTLKRKDFTIEPLTAFMNREPRHAVIAAYCGDMLSDFCDQAGRNGQAFGHMFASPFMLEETWLAQSEYPGTDMHGMVTWTSQLDNAANISFREQLSAKGRTPNVFSVLGYESGQIIAQLFRNGKPGLAGAEALKDWCFESPRGTVRIDAATNQTLPPLYHATAVRNPANGKCMVEIVAPGTDASEQWALLQEDIHALTGSATSWINTYPCIES